MDFQTVVYDKNRMCDTLLETELACSGCPLSSLNNTDSANCNEFIWEHPEDAERMIEEWVENNPEKKYPTWFNWLLQIGAIDGSEECVFSDLQREIPKALAESIGVNPEMEWN